jgi:small-conductance mechanosensitive channel
MREIFEQEFLGNSTERWVIAISAMLATLVITLIVKRGMVARVAQLSTRTTTRFDDIAIQVIQRTKLLTLIAGAIAVGARALVLPEEAVLWLDRGVIVVLAIQGALWVTDAVTFVIEARQAVDIHTPGARTMSAALAFLTRLAVWIIVTLLVLSNFGVEITALIAGLGIGGIAAALAVQNLLGDLFAAFSIYADRPFDIGDFIAVDGFLGTVDRIGWRTTTLKSLTGETIVLANSDLARSRLRNYRRMTERRIVVTFGVEYGTAAEKLAWIPKFIRETIEGIEGLRFDRSHFKGYGEFSLDFETVFYVLSPDYTMYMDRQQKLLMAIYERFEKEGISFGLPTRTLSIRQPQPNLS